MLIAETTVQIDAASLIAGLTAAGGAVAAAIVGAAKLVAGVLRDQHAENRKDRAELMEIVKGQWEQLSRLAQNTRVTAAGVRGLQKQTGAASVVEDDP